jgi:hypothetical protein
MAYKEHLIRYYVRGTKSIGFRTEIFDKIFDSRQEAARVKNQLISEGFIQVDFGIVE